jgi:hypothetical protein
MSLTSVEESLLLATYFRGRVPEDDRWRANSNQILTLSLYYTGDISYSECVSRFDTRSYVQKVYDENGELTKEIVDRYKILINLLQDHPELIEGAGDFEVPQEPTYTACRLTDAGLELAAELFDRFPKQPDFPNWPDRRSPPNRKED